ncbi:MAG: DUF1700 domain-containing protein [Ruminococcaceae bacterium]|nr:DUF1700 domain-containing protein [Oscillospiraceae bacterium]
MTRNEFFSKLEARLNILNQQERNDILNEYASHIEFKMQDGKTEEEAIADFGDVDALAEEILSAYHIDSETAWNKNGEYYIKKSVSFINHATERLLSFSLGDVAKVIVEFFIVLFVIVLIGVPFTMISDEVVYLFGFMPSPIDDAVSSITKLALDLVNLIIAFVIIYSFVKTRILNRRVEIPADRTADSSFDQPNFDVHTGKPLKKARQPREKSGDNTFGKLLANIFVWTLKIMMFIVVWLPAVLLTICAIVITVLLTLLMFTKGIGLWGLCIIGIGSCIMGIGFTAWTTNILFGGKHHG